MENSVQDGYVTEKIMEAFASGSIPIYYGAKEVLLDFNFEAFIFCESDDSLDDLAKCV